MTAKRKPYSADAERQRLIRLIHVAKRDLNMQEDAYRAALNNASGGKDSSSAMTVPELEKVVAHMKKCGFKVRLKAKPRSRPLAQLPEDRKIRALWLLLHDLGEVQNPSEEALAGYVKRMTKVDALQWIDGDQSLKVIESLKKWAMRKLPAKVKALAEELNQAVRSGMLELPGDEAGNLNAVLNAAFSRATFDPMNDAWEALRKALMRPETPAC